MRVRSVVLFLALIMLAALVALNLNEFLRPTELNLAWRTVQVPLGLVMLVVVVLALLFALIAGAYDQNARMQEQRAAAKELQAQRDLADKAEASRLVEVQRHLDLQSQASQHREREMLARLGERLDQMQHDLQRQMDDMGNTLAAYIGEVEDRLERRRVFRPNDEDRG